MAHVQAPNVPVNEGRNTHYEVALSTETALEVQKKKKKRIRKLLQNFKQLSVLQEARIVRHRPLTPHHGLP